MLRIQCIHALCVLVHELLRLFCDRNFLAHADVVYQRISASNVFGVVCLYNDEEFFMLFVHLFLFKLYLIDFSWDLNCITLLCALTRCSLT